MSRKATACVTLTMSFSSSATGVGLRLTSISPLEKNSSIHASAVWTLCSESGKYTCGKPAASMSASSAAEYSPSNWRRHARSSSSMPFASRSSFAASQTPSQ